MILKIMFFITESIWICECTSQYGYSYLYNSQVSFLIFIFINLFVFCNILFSYFFHFLFDYFS